MEEPYATRQASVARHREREQAPDEQAQAMAVITDRPVLPPRNPMSGFWAASQRNGFDASATWTMAGDALAGVFGLSAIEARDLLDSDVGCLLADDLAFIEGGPTDAAAIETLLIARLRHVGWQRLYRQAIEAIREYGKHIYDL